MSGTELLFVAMGVPRQENFIEEQWDRLGARVVSGVGGTSGRTTITADAKT
jgi:N-acetylglucosaminyldiphosphoundecaprenol N-acetyl-beta-D-mannosaminyltransferase